MQPFEFVMVLVSIIIALGVAELLAGVVRILRGELRSHWIHALWVFILLLLQLQYCWTLFDLEARGEWVFVDLVRLLTPPIVLFLVSSLLFPGRNERGKLDEFYYSNRKPVFGLLTAVMLYYGIINFSMSVMTAAQFSGAAMTGVLFLTPHPRTHALLTLVYTAATLFMVASFSYRLGESSF
jgi:hypothetical protein